MGSNKDLKVIIKKNQGVNVEKYSPLMIKLKTRKGRKFSSRISNLKSFPDFFTGTENANFIRVESANFNAFDQEILQELKYGELEDKYRNLRKGNEWVLKGLDFLEIVNSDY